MSLPIPLIISNENPITHSYNVVTALKDEGKDKLVLWKNVLPPKSAAGTQPPRRWELSEMKLPDGVNIEWENLEVINSSGVIAAIGNGGHALLLVPVEIRDLKDLDDSNDDVLIKSLDSLLDASPASVAWIEPHKKTLDIQPAAYDAGDDPRMPQLAVQLKGLPAAVQVKWKFDCKYNRPNGRTIAEDEVKLPADGSFKVVAGDQPWNLYQEYAGQPFFGGDVTLIYQVVAPNGTVLVPMTTASFRIAGKNPDNSRARLYLNATQPDLWYAYAICKHETAEFRYQGTFYNQFVGNPVGKTLLYRNYNNRRFTFKWGEPTWNWDGSDSKPGGFGLFQVTGWQGAQLGNVPRDVIWNWERNMAEAANEIRRDKVPGATAYFSAVRSKYGAGVPDAPLVRTGKSRDLTGFEADVIVRYNGVGKTPYHPELSRWLPDDTRDPWTYTNGQWKGPVPNVQNYLNKVLPEFE